MNYSALFKRLVAIALMFPGALVAQDWLCRASLDQSKEVQQWLVAAYGAPVRLMPLETHAFQLGAPIETLQPSQVTGAAIDSSQSWRLRPELPFVYSDSEGVPALSLAVDSFVYVIDKRYSLFQVVAIGSDGLVLNAFWLREALFVVLFADWAPGKGTIAATYATCYDLKAMVTETYRPAATHPLKPLFWKSYATTLHTSHKGGA